MSRSSVEPPRPAPSPPEAAAASSPTAELPALRWICACLCALLVLVSGYVRAATAEADHNFRAAPLEGLLKSDPGLLYALTARVAAADGLLPADFRSDTRVQYPRQTDLLAEFTVGQEFLVGWLHRFLGADTALHLFALRVMALSAALATVGAYLLTLACTGRSLWALFAATLFALLPANHRTIGFILVREDLAFPAFALHLGCLALAVRRRSPPLFLAAGLTLALALSTWHASGFLLALELACVLAWVLFSGDNPLERRASWLVVVPVLLAGLAVPALRAQGVAFSWATLVAWSLALSALLRRRLPLRWPVRPLVLASLVLLAGGILVQSPGELGGYAHVYEVLWAKIRHLGRFPHSDPASLSFDARLLWQGPFATLNVGWFLAWHGWTLALVAGGLVAWGVAGRAASRAGHAVGPHAEPAPRALIPVVLTGLLVGCVAAWLFERLQILPGLLLPVVCGVSLARLCARGGPGAGRLVFLLAAAVLFLQGTAFARFVGSHVGLWYVPAVRQAEIAAVVDWVRTELGPDEPVLADFMNSTALLAHVGTPIVLQPKYETAESRRRAEAFLSTFYFGTTEELGRLAKEEFQTRYLMVDRYTLWGLARATAGLPADAGEPPAGSPAAAFLSTEEARLRGVPGFTLVYRSPPELRWSESTAGGAGMFLPGEASDFFRVYRIE